VLYGAFYGRRRRGPEACVKYCAQGHTAAPPLRFKALGVAEAPQQQAALEV
jgi:hypothetical protein